ncbi:hypothetical protein D3C76_695530 [compost metagenome]
MKLKEGNKYVGIVSGKVIEFEVDTIHDERHVRVIFENGKEDVYWEVLILKWIEDYEKHMSKFYGE